MTISTGSDTSPSDHRLPARDIFESAVEVAREELDRKSRALFFSGVAGGIGMGLTALGVAVVVALLGDDPPGEFISLLFYPLGFIVVIIGRAQLFTENTLFPVVLGLRERDHVAETARVWVVVLLANVVGALLFALLVMKTGALESHVASTLVDLGATAATSKSFSQIFWSGIVGGWIIALAAWLVTAARQTFAQVALIWFATFVVGAGHFAHSIAGSAEILSAVLQDVVPVGTYLGWLVAAVLGNALGGVVIVSLLNYGQVESSSRSG